MANRHRYIGKETSRRWEQGDDLSLVDFRCAEYVNGKMKADEKNLSLVDFRCAGYVDGKMKADEKTRRRIIEIGIRKVARKSGVNRETVALVANGRTVKSGMLRKMIDFMAKGAR